MSQSNEDNNLFQIDKNIGAKLKKARELRSVSRQTLGEHIGMSVFQVEKYELGTNRLSAALLFKISKYLNLPVSFFFDE
jgi:transcriptional regulator with XRE-family HTH domain